MHGTNGSGLLDWNDARIFLAVARHGSLRAAGRALGISQPTIGRRIAAFEAVFGGPTLFDRLPEGLRLNEAGAALLPVAEQLEDAALSLERHRAAASSVLSGTVRISVGEWAAAFLTCHIGSSSENPPPTGITLELVQTIQTANLARREADLAVRHYPPESGDLYISKLGVFAGAIGCDEPRQGAGLCCSGIRMRRGSPEIQAPCQRVLLDYRPANAGYDWT
jgi:DNA-binding transcriptional LysR family regulator